MAQPANYCDGHCYVNACISYVSPNEVWDYDIGKPFPNSVGDTIHNENMETLSLSINDERSRRGLSSFSFDSITGSDEGGTTLIYGNHSSQEMMKDIKDSINGISSGYVTYNVVDGQPLTYSQINEERTKIDYLRASCMCNSDCGGHQVCDCYNDCGCNY